jgi:biopolymer transport protein ExbD
MIDVVFQLLIFFMVGASYKQTETELRVKLPSPGSAVHIPVSVQVDIDPGGLITVNETPYDSPTSRELPQLREKFKALLATDPSLPVIIAPNPETPHQRVVDVLNACHATGVTNISFAGGG